MDTAVLRSLFDYDDLIGALRWSDDQWSQGSKGRLNARAGQIAGCIDKNGYRIIRIKNVNCFAHRIVWQIHYGDAPPAILDHINRDKGDNRICNLRPATSSQNAKNSNSSRKSKCGYRGVYFRYGKYRARIRYQTNLIEIGAFATPELAHDAYTAKAVELFGPFANAA